MELPERAAVLLGRFAAGRVIMFFSGKYTEWLDRAR